MRERWQNEGRSPKRASFLTASRVRVHNQSASINFGKTKLWRQSFKRSTRALSYHAGLFSHRQSARPPTCCAPKGEVVPCSCGTACPCKLWLHAQHRHPPPRDCARYLAARASQGYLELKLLVPWVHEGPLHASSEKGHKLSSHEDRDEGPSTDSEFVGTEWHTCHPNH